MPEVTLIDAINLALARKLAVIMHRMLVDGTLFASAAGAA